MTKIEERSREIVELLRSYLNDETGNVATHDAQRIIVCHEKVAQLHEFARAGVPGRFARHQHGRATRLHTSMARAWTVDLQSGGLIHTFGDTKSLRWILLNYDGDDNGGCTRLNHRLSLRAAAATQRIKKWSDRDYVWRAPDLSPDCPDGTCR